jgi:DNA polymerase-3 subunit delta
MTAELPPVHLLLGDVALLVQEAEEQLIAQCFEGRSPGFNFTAFDAAEGGHPLQLANTLPMMAKRRMVLIRGMEKAPVALLEALLQYVEKPNPATVLVLVGPRLPEASEGKDHGRRLENKIKALGGVRRFSSRDQDPLAFALASARKLGVDMDREAAQLLVELVGGDLGRLRTEVDKAWAYIGGQGRIQSAVIEQTASMVAEAVIWDLTDAVVARDSDRGLCALHRMLEEGGRPDDEVPRLMAMVALQLRRMLELQSAMRANQPLPEDWQKKPWRKREAAIALLRRRPLEPVRTLEALTRASREMHRSRAGSRRIFEGLVVELVAG